MKLVLIDRDGVINEEIAGYVTHPGELHILPDALAAFALLKQEGFTAVVATNQSVVGRGMITEARLEEIHAFMKERIREHGGEVAEVLTCTDHPASSGFRRKPKPGMLLEALAKYGAVPEETPFIGDAATDLEAAFAAGCQRYLVLTGKGQQTAAVIPEEWQPVTVCANLLDAARKIVHKRSLPL